LTIPAVWLPLLAFTARSPWLFVAIGIAIPFLALFFYELAVQSQIALGEVVKAAIDKHRFDLLSDVLRQPLPTTLSAERDLWRRLRQAEEGARIGELTYRHSPEPARPS